MCSLHSKVKHYGYKIKTWKQNTQPQSEQNNHKHHRFELRDSTIGNAKRPVYPASLIFIRF